MERILAGLCAVNSATVAARDLQREAEVAMKTAMDGVRAVQEREMTVLEGDRVMQVAMALEGVHIEQLAVAAALEREQEALKLAETVLDCGAWPSSAGGGEGVRAMTTAEMEAFFEEENPSEHEEEEETQTPGRYFLPLWLTVVATIILRYTIFGRNLAPFPLRMHSSEYERLRIALLKADPDFWKKQLGGDPICLEPRKPTIKAMNQPIYAEDHLIVPTLLVLFNGEFLKRMLLMAIEPPTMENFKHICALISNTDTFPLFKPVDLLAAMKTTEAWIYKETKLQGIVAIADTTIIRIWGGRAMKLLTVVDHHLRILAYQLFDAALSDLDCFRRSNFYKDYLNDGKSLGAFKCRQCVVQEHWINATILADFSFSEEHFSHVNVLCFGGYEQSGKLMESVYATTYKCLENVRFAIERIYGHLFCIFGILFSGRMREDSKFEQVYACMVLHQLLRSHQLKSSDYQCKKSQCPCAHSTPSDTAEYRSVSSRNIRDSIISATLNCFQSQVKPVGKRYISANGMRKIQSLDAYNDEQAILPFVSKVKEDNTRVFDAIASIRAITRDYNLELTEEQRAAKKAKYYMQFV